MSPNQTSSLPVQNTFNDNPAALPRRTPPDDSFASKFLRFFNNAERRIAERRSQSRVVDPPLRAYLGVFGSTQPYPVGNISSTGFYLVTDDHWLPGTNMPLRLERTDKPGYAALHCVTVPTRVVRSDAAGVGFAFILKERSTTFSSKRSSLQDTEGGWLGAQWGDRQTIEELVAELDTAQAGPYESD